MKYFRLFFVFILLLLSNIFLFADVYVDPSSLPSKAKKFISDIFPSTTYWSVELDGNKYEVELSNGVSIEFTFDGEWIKVEAEYLSIPISILPKSVANTVRNRYPNALIIETEKSFGNYKIKLNNFIEMYIGPSGQFLGQKFDD